MAKKVYTIDVASKNLKVSAKPSESKSVKTQEKKEVENFGIVEINNASATKKIKNNVEKGFEKNLSGTAKKSVKAETAKVEDYFDFSFRTNQSAKKVSETKEEKVETKTKSAVKKSESKVEKTSVQKVDDTQVAVSVKNIDDIKSSQSENVSKSVKFDNDANQIVRVARIGSLFDCEKRMMNA